MGDVIQKHPQLATVTCQKSDPNNKDFHRAWKARLEVINLDDCVTFVEDYDECDGLKSLFEQLHNQWFDAKDMTKPRWQLIIVNGIHAIFRWDHIICDGIGGLAFHKSLLAALNKAETATEHTECASGIKSAVTTSTRPLGQDTNSLLKLNGYTWSILDLAFKIIYLNLLRLFLPRSWSLFSDVKHPRVAPSVGTPTRRTITKLSSFQLSPKILDEHLRLCRLHKTTLTALLQTIILITLSSDVYPKAKRGSIATQVNLRRYVDRLPTDEVDDLRNASSAFYHRVWLGNYRIAAGIETQRLDSNSSIPVNRALFWSLVKQNSDKLHANLSRPDVTPQPIQDLLSMETLPKSEEAFAARCLPSIEMMIDDAFTISNLGVFSAGDKKDRWQIVDAEFSSAATQSSVGYPLYFAMLTSQNGGCRVNISWVEGLFSEEVVDNVVQSVKKRLIGLLDKE